MASFQSVVPSCVSWCNGGGSSVMPAEAGDELPAGLKVLVVDDDSICLKILDKMLRRCLYQVTLCSSGTAALNHLRERKGYFDVVLTDVHMPDMDGFELLECIGTEMDVPVIMMSADKRTSVIMEGIKHGACDYLVKPVRNEEIKNIWQHVARKRFSEKKEIKLSGGLEDTDRHKQGKSEAECDSSVNEGTEGKGKNHKKKSSTKDGENGDNENEDYASKKPRLIWTVELHQKFFSAVEQLGIDKAVPKRILELMDEPNLSRENVASHLQKFRSYLRKIRMEQQQQSGNPFLRPVEPDVMPHLQALAASEKISPQKLAALHAELLGQPVGNHGQTRDQPAMLHATVPRPIHATTCHSMTSRQPLIRPQYFPQSIIYPQDASSGGQWWSTSLGNVAANNNLRGFSTQSNNMPVELNRHQQLLLSEPVRSINAQPSCLVAPLQSSSARFQAGNTPGFVNQSSSFNRSTAVDYSLLSAHASNNSLTNFGWIPGHHKTNGLLPTPLFPVISRSSTSRQKSPVTFGDSSQVTGQLHITSNMQDMHAPKSREVLDQGACRSLGFVSVRNQTITSNNRNEIDTRIYSGDEFDLQGNLNNGSIHIENAVNPVKLDANIDIVDNTNDAPVDPRVSSNDDTTSTNSEQVPAKRTPEY